jgi:hypothetical protein
VGPVRRGGGRTLSASDQRKYRELEAGERLPSFDTHDRICKLFGWPGKRSISLIAPALTSSDGDRRSCDPC